MRMIVDTNIIRVTQGVFLSLLLLTGPLWAATTRYASVGGTGSPPCTNSGAPCHLYTAVPLLQPGDTLMLSPGGPYPDLFVGNVHIPSGSGTGSEPLDGPWPNAITITSSPCKSAELKKIALQLNLDGSGVSYVIFDCLNLHGHGAPDAFAVSDKLFYTQTMGVHHIRLQNSDLHDNNEILAACGRASHHIVYRNNRFYNRVHPD